MISTFVARREGALRSAFSIMLGSVIEPFARYLGSAMRVLEEGVFLVSLYFLCNYTSTRPSTVRRSCFAKALWLPASLVSTSARYRLRQKPCMHDPCI